MGQKAKNAGKKASKTCNKLATTKSVSSNINRKEIRCKVKITKNEEKMRIALELPDIFKEENYNLSNIIFNNNDSD